MANGKATSPAVFVNALRNRDLLHPPTSEDGTAMSKLQRDVLDCIGNTSLLALRNIVPKNGSRLLLKATQDL